MQLKKDFSENMTVAVPGDDTVTIDNFDRYIEQFGTERAQGYMDALNDVIRQMNSYFREKSGNVYIPFSAQVIRRETKKLQEEKIALMEAGMRIIEAKKRASQLEEPKL